jgi:hypothetical protein
MLEPDDTIISRTRARVPSSVERWKEVRGVPVPATTPFGDLIGAQGKAFRCLIKILDTPLTGDPQHDYLARRNMVEAARVLLALRAAPLPVTFPLPKLETPSDAAAAIEAILAAVSGGLLQPLEGAELSRSIEVWLRALKVSKMRPFNKKERQDAAE